MKLNFKVLVGFVVFVGLVVSVRDNFRQNSEDFFQKKKKPDKEKTSFIEENYFFVELKP